MKYRQHIPLVIRCIVSFVAFLLGPGSTPSSAESAPPHFRVGVNPNIAFIQPAIIAGEGWAREEGFEFEVVVATGPATQLQAFLSGAIDGMANNVGTLLLGAEKLQGTKDGLPRVLATISRGSISLLARNPTPGFKARTTEELAHNLRLWSEQKQHPLQLVANPKGSLPDLVPRYFLAQNKLTDSILIKNAGDQAQLQQFALAPNSDLISTFEPLTTLLPKLDPSLRVIADPDVLMDRQPGCVLAVSGAFFKNNPAIVSKLARLIARANIFIDQHPQESVNHIDRVLTRGIAPKETLLEALPHIQRNYPMKEAKAGTLLAYSFMRDLGYLLREFPVEEMFAEADSQ